MALTEEEHYSNRLRRIYDMGTPFFTKGALKNILPQLENNTNRRVRLTGLDGKEVVFDLEVGRVMPNQSPFSESSETQDTDIEAVWYKAVPRYLSIHQLTMPEFHRNHAEHPFLPITIGYAVEYRKSRTQAPVTRLPRYQSPEALRRRFEDQKLFWKNSDQFIELLYILTTAPILPSITKIVAFACGSMTWNDGNDGSGARHARQHAVILSLRDFLKEKQRRQVLPCYAQDPEYVEDDWTTLQPDNITVLDDPRGFLEVDDETLVFGIAPDFPFRQIIADIARPGIIIWDKVVPNRLPFDANGEISVDDDSSSPRLLNMVRDYYWEYDLSNDKECITNARVYVRKPSVPA